MKCIEPEICSEKRIEEKEAFRVRERESSFLWFSLPFSLRLPASLFFPLIPLYYLIKSFYPFQFLPRDLWSLGGNEPRRNLCPFSTQLLLSNRWPATGQDHDDFGSQPILLP